MDGTTPPALLPKLTEVTKQGHSGSIAQRPVRKAVSYHRLFTAGWFGMREKHCFRLEIYDRLRASEQAEHPR